MCANGVYLETEERSEADRFHNRFYLSFSEQFGEKIIIKRINCENLIRKCVLSLLFVPFYVIFEPKVATQVAAIELNQRIYLQ